MVKSYAPKPRQFSGRPYRFRGMYAYKAEAEKDGKALVKRKQVKATHYRVTRERAGIYYLWTHPA